MSLRPPVRAGRGCPSPGAGRSGRRGAAAAPSTARRSHRHPPHGCAGSAATERRETGTEDHARIQQVRIGHYTFVQARNRLVQQRQDQAVLQIGRGLQSLATSGFFGLPFSQVRCPGHPSCRACPVPPSAGRRNLQAEERRQFAAHARSHVQPHGVDQFDRSHRHAELHGALSITGPGMPSAYAVAASSM